MISQNQQNHGRAQYQSSHANVYCGINSGPAWIAAAAGVPTKLWLRDYKEHPTDTGLRFVKLLVQQSNVEVIEWIDRR